MAPGQPFGTAPDFMQLGSPSFPGGTASAQASTAAGGGGTSGPVIAVVVVLAVLALLGGGGALVYYLIRDGAGSSVSGPGGVGGGGGAGGSGGDEAKIRALYEGYADDLSDGDIAGARSRVCPEATELDAMLDMLEDIVGEIGASSLERVTVNVYDIEIDGDRATLRADIEGGLTAQDGAYGKVRRDGSGWCMLQ